MTEHNKISSSKNKLIQAVNSKERKYEKKNDGEMSILRVAVPSKAKTLYDTRT